MRNEKMPYQFLKIPLGLKSVPNRREASMSSENSTDTDAFHY